MATALPKSGENMDNQNNNVDEQLADALATLQELTGGETDCRVSRYMEVSAAGNIRVFYSATVGDIIGGKACKWEWMHRSADTMAEAVAQLTAEVATKGDAREREVNAIKAKADLLGFNLVAKGAA